MMIEEFLTLGTAACYEAQGQSGAMDSGIKPVDTAMSMVGTALTVRTRPGDNLVVHLAMTRAQPGDILVIDGGGYTEVALWGDVLAEAALARGVAGVVIDGAARDTASLAQMKYPTFCRGTSIKGPSKFGTGTIGEPVTCGSVLVSTGDVIVGDRDGVVAIAANRAGEVLDLARRRTAREGEIRIALQQGRTTVELLDLSSELARLGLR